jgi:hypothetical protein
MNPSTQPSDAAGLAESACCHRPAVELRSGSGDRAILVCPRCGGERLRQETVVKRRRSTRRGCRRQRRRSDNPARALRQVRDALKKRAPSACQVGCAVELS